MASSSDVSQRKFTCSKCNATFGTQLDLNRHMLSRHKLKKLFRCTKCDYVTPWHTSFKRHMLHHVRELREMCGYTVNDVDPSKIGCEEVLTSSHRQVQHTERRPAQEKFHQCTVCQYASAESDNLNRHMQTHSREQPHLCPYCTYSCNDVYSLKRHLNYHSAEKPFQCSLCRERFSQFAQLKAHRLCHFKIKPIFKCPMCAVGLAKRNDLLFHIERVHVNGTVRQDRLGRTFYISRSRLNSFVTHRNPVAEAAPLEPKPDPDGDLATERHGRRPNPDDDNVDDKADDSLNRDPGKRGGQELDMFNMVEMPVADAVDVLSRSMARHGDKETNGDAHDSQQMETVVKTEHEEQESTKNSLQNDHQVQQVVSGSPDAKTSRNSIDTSIQEFVPTPVTIEPIPRSKLFEILKAAKPTSELDKTTATIDRRNEITEAGSSELSLEDLAGLEAVQQAMSIADILFPSQEKFSRRQTQRKRIHSRASKVLKNSSTAMKTNLGVTMYRVDIE